MYLYRNIEVGGKSGQPPKEAVQTLGRRSDGEPMANPQWTSYIPILHTVEEWEGGPRKE
jgi:hypothetical protein